MYFFVSNYLAAEYYSVPNTCLQIGLCYHNGFLCGMHVFMFNFKMYVLQKFELG